ncbi:hypothetical protein BJV78DRAFT_1239575 [Lactifluus subvellereus]|nr:hypothetical protein BJV78DRAFT_1239575 [Lactifluus subvellereus]
MASSPSPSPSPSIIRPSPSCLASRPPVLHAFLMLVAMTLPESVACDGTGHRGSLALARKRREKTILGCRTIQPLTMPPDGHLCEIGPEVRPYFLAIIADSHRHRVTPGPYMSAFNHSLST